MNQEPGFFRRQFVGKPTSAQLSFDVVFGIALPILCVAFDPIVFQPSFGGSFLDGYQAAALLVVFIGIGAISLWLATGRLAAMLTGVLALCGCFAGVLGILLLPLSVLGTLYAGIGLLGFTPFFTAFAFARNAVRAWSTAVQRSNRQVVAITATISFTLIPIAVWAAESYARRQQAVALAALLSDDASDDEAAIHALNGYAVRYFGSDSSLDSLVREYEWEENVARRERFAAAYVKLTGRSIEDRLFRLHD